MSLLNIAKKLPPIKTSSVRNSIVKDVEPAKHVSPPPVIMKKAEKQNTVLKKAVEKPVILKEEIITPEKVSEPQITSSGAVVQYEDNAPSVVDEKVFSANNKAFEQSSIDTYEDYSGVQGDGAVLQGQRYVDENFYYVKDLITRNLGYPVVARRMKWQGTVEVSFVVLKTGNVENIRIITSSGHSVLDKNVIAAIQQVQPFPAPPVQAEFTMPIKYTLK